MFPSFQVLGIGQTISTVLVLWISKNLGYVSFPALQVDTFKRIWPLPLIHAGNMMTGLGSTQHFNTKKIFDFGDHGFGILYSWDHCFLVSAVFCEYNAFWSPRGNKPRFILQFLGICSLKKCFLFYNSLFITPFAVCFAWWTENVQAAWKFGNWGDVWFLTQFIASCLMGFVTYLGMVIGGDDVQYFL